MDSDALFLYMYNMYMRNKRGKIQNKKNLVFHQKSNISKSMEKQRTRKKKTMMFLFKWKYHFWEVYASHQTVI